MLLVIWHPPSFPGNEERTFFCRKFRIAFFKFSMRNQIIGKEQKKVWAMYENDSFWCSSILLSCKQILGPIYIVLSVHLLWQCLSQEVQWTGLADAGGSSRCRNPGLMLLDFSVWVATSIPVITEATEAKRLQLCARWRPQQVPCKQLQPLLRNSDLNPQPPLLYQPLGARDFWGLSCLSVLFCRAREGNLCWTTARSAFCREHW